MGTNMGIVMAVEERLRSERMKTELISNVSHDLKTPLTSIINYIVLLKRDDLPPETKREYLEVLDRHSAKLKKLTEGVIEASKAASGVMPMHPEFLDVRELLEQAVGSMPSAWRRATSSPLSTRRSRRCASWRTEGCWGGCWTTSSRISSSTPSPAQGPILT